MEAKHGGQRMGAGTEKGGVAGILPMGTLMPVVTKPGTDEFTEAVLEGNQKLADLHDFIQLKIPGSRERSLVLTKLEEAQHWLVATQAG